MRSSTSHDGNDVAAVGHNYISSAPLKDLIEVLKRIVDNLKVQNAVSIRWKAV